MKKYLLIIISLLIMPIGVFAASDDTIVVDFGKIKYMDDITIIQSAALSVLDDNGIIKNNYDDENYIYIENSSGKKLVKYDYENNIYTVMSGITSADNITYNITEEDRGLFPGIRQILKNKNKILIKYDGVYQSKGDCNIYYYDMNRTINETPDDIMRMNQTFSRYGIVDIEKNDLFTYKIYKHNKLLATIDDLNMKATIPSNVTENDNISIDVDAIDSIIEKKMTKEYITSKNQSSCKRINLLFAKETSDSLVRIKGIKYLDKSDGTSVVEVPTYNKLNVNSNVTFTNANDFVQYKIIIENKDKDDYKMTLESDDTKYIDYKLVAEDGSNIAKANSDTTVYLTIRYKGAPESEFVEGYFKASKSLKINMRTNSKNIIVNPKTGGILVIVTILIILMVISILMFKSKKVKPKTFLVLIGLLIAIPSTVLALKELSMTVNSEIIVPSSSVKNRLYINNQEVDLSNSCKRVSGVFYASIKEVPNMERRLGDIDYVHIYIDEGNIELYGEYSNSKLVIYDIFFDNENTITINGQKNKPLAMMDYIEKYYNEHGLPDDCEAEEIQDMTIDIPGLNSNIQYEETE